MSGAQQILLPPYRGITPPGTTKEGHIARFFVVALGRALAAKMSPDQPRAFKKLINSQVFPFEKTIFFIFFLNEPVLGNPRHV